MKSPLLPATFALALFLLLPFSSADFSMKSLSVLANVNMDGSVNVEERLEIVIDRQSSRELYEVTRSAYSDLATWKNRTALSEVRHHVTRANAEIENLRVTPQAVERCNSFMGICHATIVMDYSVPASQNGSGLIRVSRYKPRTMRYSLAQDALSFEQTKNGDLLLPAGTTITIALPPQAKKIYFSAPPQNLEQGATYRYDSQTNLRYYAGPIRSFTWGGDTLPKFEFSYEIESPLEDEVLEFFTSAEKNLVGFMLGPEGAAALFIIAAAASSVYYFNRHGGKQR